MTIPISRSRLSLWKLSPDDFSYLCDQKGNGANVIALSYSWFNLLKDSPIADDKPHSVAAKFYRRLSDPEQLPDMIKEFSGLADRFLAETTVRADGSTSTPHLFREFAKTPVFREFHYWVRTRDPLTASFLHTFLDFGRKAEYVNDELKGLALSSWLDTEDMLRRLELPAHIVEDLRRLISLSGLEYAPERLFPKHGPRQVAEKLKNVSVHGKNLVMGINAEIQSFLDTLAYHHDQDGYNAPGIWYTLPDTQMLYTFLSEQLVAALEFVAKDIKSMRSICMEAAVLMWAQQGLLRALKVGITRSKFHSVIDIENQQLNVDSCIIASSDRINATSDLSRASDCVSWKLVRQIFPESLVQLLGMTRSQHVRMPEEDEFGPIILKVEKFAPMGSALCFPIQSIIFAAVVALARVVTDSRLSASSYITEGMSIVNHFPKYDVGTRVYGDDIIAPVLYTECVMMLLESLGFEVNRRKSFTGNQAVRESCGAFAMLGYDIAGLKFKVRNLISGDYDSWLGLISLANRAFDRGYYNLRDALRDLLPYNTYVEMPRESCYSTQSFVLWSKREVEILEDDRWDPIVGHLPSDRHNPRLNRWERKVMIARCVPQGHKDEVIPVDYGTPDDSSNADARELDGTPVVAYQGAQPHENRSTYPVRDGRGRIVNRGPVIEDLEVYHLGQTLFEQAGIFQTATKKENRWDDYLAPLSKSHPRTGLEFPASVRLRWVPIA